MTYITTTPATTHAKARRGQDDPENRGRSAQVFEDYNEQHFQSEYSDMFVLGIWAVGFLAAAAAFIAGPLIITALAAIF
jgi:hypothetical protein